MKAVRLAAAAVIFVASGVNAQEESDPRVGLKAGLWDAGQVAWNMRLLSTTRPSEAFLGKTNSDLAFTGHYVIEGNYAGFQVWDIADPAHPTLTVAYVCPTTQGDVSVYGHLLFVSAEAISSRLDCGTQGVSDTVSQERMRGLRIFDIRDLAHPKNVANVQTCRGSHTHTVVVDPKDPKNVYVYISGAAPVRSPRELAGCVKVRPFEDPNSALFRIEVIKVPLAHPQQARIVDSPRLFEGLAEAGPHGQAPADQAEMAAARARGAYTATFAGQEVVLGNAFVNPLLDSIVKARGGTGAPTAADSAALRDAMPRLAVPLGNPYWHTACHDITAYPQMGLAGGACEGYGLLLDIRDPSHPSRVDAVTDSNFSYWHSATFNNDGSKILFTDEWGGGTLPKCRATDPQAWGADAIFAIVDRKMVFRGYYKLPAPQGPYKNCVAHNGSLIPIPGRDIEVQAWYQGGISVFDWTDAAHPTEVAFFDRGPIDSTRLSDGGAWSSYWYNGLIVSSEIARGLDVLELLPSALISKNEIEAAKSVQFRVVNTQAQRRFVWPPSVALAGAYVDQLERSRGLPPERITEIRAALPHVRLGALEWLARDVEGDVATSSDSVKVRTLVAVIRALAVKH